MIFSKPSYPEFNPLEFMDEHQHIQERRNKQWPEIFAESGSGNDRKNSAVTDPKRKTSEPELIGLALSGGGIRSAMYGFGMLKGLYKSGLLRYVDYVSSVSGGSYIAAHMLSHIQSKIDQSERKQEPVHVLRPPMESKETEQTSRDQNDKLDQTTPPWVTLVQGGRYLRTPVRLMTQYLWGIVGNLLVFGSLFIFFCTSIAYVWRLFDYQCVVDLLRYIKPEWELDVDLVRAFIPFLLPLLIVIGITALLWIAARLRGWQVDHGPKRFGWHLVARCLFWFTFVIGILTILANGDTSLGLFTKVIPGGPSSDAIIGDKRLALDHVTSTQTLHLITAIVVLLSSAIPLLVPQQFLASGAHPRRPFQLHVFKWVACMLVLGMPLLGIHYFASENVSGVAPTKIPLPLDQYFDHELAQAIVAIQSPRSFPLTAKGELSWSDQELLIQEYLGTLAAECKALGGDCDRSKEFAAKLGVNYARIYPKDLQSKLEELTKALVPLPHHDLFNHEWRAYRDTARVAIRSLHERGPERGEEVKRYYAYGPWPVDEIGKPYYARAALTPKGQLIDADQTYRLRWIFASGIVFLLSASLIDLNATSLHGFYRERLRSYYLKDQPIYRIKDLAPWEAGAPFPIICATMNLVGWRKNNCKTWTFQFTPLKSRSSCKDFALDERELHYDDELADVVSLSSAAFSPAQFGSSLIAVALALFNLRLGQWVHIPRRRVHARWNLGFASLVASLAVVMFKIFWHRTASSEVGIYVWRSIPIASSIAAITLIPFPWRHGATTLLRIAPWFFWKAEDRPYVFLSDGGHNENLGIWPLIERRCKLIIACDATADPEYHFEDLAKLMQRCKMTRGIEFLNAAGTGPLDLEPLIPRRLRTSPERLKEMSENDQRYSESHFVLGRIRYHDGAFSHLVYLKSAVTGREATELLKYVQREKLFPNDPTTDQLYDDDQCEAYRQLGLAASGSMVAGQPNVLAEKPFHEVAELWRMFRLAAAREPSVGGLLKQLASDRKRAESESEVKKRFDAGVKLLVTGVATSDVQRTTWTPRQRLANFAAHVCDISSPDFDDRFLDFAVNVWRPLDDVHSKLGDTAKGELEFITTFAYELAERFNVNDRDLARFILACLGDSGWKRRPPANKSPLNDLTVYIESREPGLSAWLHKQLELN